MKEIWENLGMDTAASAASFGIEQVGNAINMKRQHKYQKKINKYNQELAFDLWERTGPKGMMEQLTKAGLNPGLMYGMSGAGAGTTATGAGSGTGSQSANAQMQLGLGLQLQQQKAMIENTKADTQLKQAEAIKKAGVDTQEAQSRIENLKADVNNKAVSNSLMNLELKIKEATGMENAELANDQLRQGIEKIEADTKLAITEGKIKEESANALIKQARAAVIEQQLRISLQRGGIIKLGAETQQIRAATGKIADEIVKMYNDMRVANESVNQRDLEIKIKEGLAELQKVSTEFNTGWMAEIERGSRIIENSAGAIGKLLPINRAKKAGNFPAKKPDWMSQKQWEYINNND